jgi:hypothetical protein
MVSQDGGRWDVGAANKAVLLERRSEDDEPIFAARLEPDEARELGQLLIKKADSAESTKNDADDSDEETEKESESAETDDD